MLYPPPEHPMAALVFPGDDATTSRNLAPGLPVRLPARAAVDFVVESSDRQSEAQKLVPRDFRQLPTFGAPTKQFVYGVPRGAAQTSEDLRLREETAGVLSEYRKRCAECVGPGKRGAAALLRARFDDGTGRCDPSQARLPIREKDSGYREKNGVDFPGSE